LVGFLRSLFAFGTVSRELKSVRVDQIIGHPGKDPFDFRNRLPGKIVHTTTPFAPNVIVILRGGVETLLGSREIQFTDYTRLGQDLQVTINRAKADIGQSLPNYPVDLIRGGMSLHLEKLF